jgi:ribose-phosphate pyrophosphokinase
MNFNLKLVSGTANTELAQEISRCLNVPLSQASAERFIDGEIMVKVDDSVRGCDVFVIQPMCHPVNSNIMEIFLIVDALHRASAARIAVVIPYYAYARQDHKTKPRVPIAAALLARFLQETGVNHVITLELHAGQIQGFFEIPVDNISCKSVLGKSIKRLFGHIDNLVVVSPDAAGGERAERFRAYLQTEEDMEADFAIMNKWNLKKQDTQDIKRGTVVKIAPPVKEFKMELMGNVQDRVCVIVDDLTETGSTILAAAKCLRENGASRVIACVSHCLLDTDAIARVLEDPNLDTLITTDTVPPRGNHGNNHGTNKLHTKQPSISAFGGVDIDVDYNNSIKSKKYPKFVHVSVAPILAECIRRVHNEESISSSFFI